MTARQIAHWGRAALTRCWPWHFASLCVVLCAPERVWAQQPGTLVSISVRGMAFDSLLNTPLIGARVWSADGQRSTITDSAGRFVLEGVRRTVGPLIVYGSHESADSLGLHVLAANVASAGESNDVVVAIPSYRTFRNAICPGARGDGSENGILAMRVSSATTGRSIAAAKALLYWRAIEAAAGSRVPKVVEREATATADSTGMVYVCDVPTDLPLAVSVYGASPGDSAVITLTVGARRLLRRDIVLGAGGRGAVLATVTSKNGQPHAGAQVWMQGVAPALTSATGLAMLPNVPAGTQTIRVRARGMEPAEQAVDIRADDTVRVAFVLAPVPQRLAPMRVSAILSGIERRKELGKGYILTGDSLTRLPSMTFAVPLRPAFLFNPRGTLPNLRLRNRLGELCNPKVLLDGARSSLGEVNSFEPSELAAVELYINFDDAPREFMRPSDYKCGLLLVWTRGNLEP